MKHNNFYIAGDLKLILLYTITVCRLICPTNFGGASRNSRGASA
jgi:hypothetical protein